MNRMYTTYGLHPTIWRMLRASYGGGSIALYGRNGAYIGRAYHFHRYSPLIAVYNDIEFAAISWKQTIEKIAVNIKNTNLVRIYEASRIPIGQNFYE